MKHGSPTVENKSRADKSGTNSQLNVGTTPAMGETTPVAPMQVPESARAPATAAAPAVEPDVSAEPVQKRSAVPASAGSLKDHNGPETHRALTPSERLDAALRRARLSGVEPVENSNFGWTKMAETTLNDGPHLHTPTPEESANAVFADKDSPAAGAKGSVPGRPFAEVENTSHPNSAYLAGVKVPEKMGEKVGEEGTAVGAADLKANPPAGVKDLTPEGLPVTAYGHVDYNPLTERPAEVGVVGVAHPDFGIEGEAEEEHAQEIIANRAANQGAMVPLSEIGPGAQAHSDAEPIGGVLGPNGPAGHPVTQEHVVGPVTGIPARRSTDVVASPTSPSDQPKPVFNTKTGQNIKKPKKH